MSACCPPPRVIVTSQPALVGEAFADGMTDLQPTASGQWTPVAGAEVTLPEPGIYEITTDVRSRIINDDGDNGWIGVRLFDVAAGAVVPGSERMVNQAVGGGGTRNLTSPVSVFVRADQPAAIRLEAQRSGNSTAADIRSDSNGWTRLAYQRASDL